MQMLIILRQITLIFFTFGYDGAKFHGIIAL